MTLNYVCKALIIMSTVWGLGATELGVAGALPGAAGWRGQGSVAPELGGLEGSGGGPGRALKAGPGLRVGGICFGWWVVLSAWLEESINRPPDLPERLFPFSRPRPRDGLVDAVGVAASVLCCDSGFAGSAGCRVLMLCLHRGPHMLSVPPPPLSSAAPLAPSWSPDPFGSGIAGASVPFPLLVAALLCSAVQTPLPAPRALADPCALFSGSGLLVFGAVRMRCCP